MKLLVRAPMTPNRIEELENYFSEVVYLPWTETGERYYEDAMLESLKKYEPDVLITELDRITKKVLDNYHNLQAIGDCRANPANIDVDACTAAGIPVLCTPARNCQAVAEMVVGLVLTLYRNIIPATQWVKEMKWVEGTTPYYLWMGHELQGKNIGFVGFGAVGKATAHLFEAFGCEISFYDPYVEAVSSSYRKCSVEEIFSENDIVSIHLPVLDSTRGMINKKLFSLMKPDSLFVNSARSAVVDYESLCEALKEKQISGAILDVLDTEPPKPEDLEILSYPNVLLTPHICGASYEVTSHQSDIITNNVIQWLEGRNLESVVYNKHVLKSR
ncbi:2-hydroxyacid dehydrogenase [Sediminispirochaeta smaragdinae]|uniref:D-isomer specific 2-hydroxyacid dehydrogenase NAD-binding protein n=1 Tax=Sediminispirochaeta smaragdinae (strain DSM 11293 / JCM 15392 / SEBR 4228) TaxID=573413 RepID=E1R1Y1_SEDSS|nr:2-hydroxyacid dehydrogenase [Sediminispirochaeta smaragdinae]ADK81507.1 D-isomer specific 2-hydroxyacid dehydrogenase NAD-binding protein [Sediminispirochaeta smaragdinae DSM 11293]